MPSPIIDAQLGIEQAFGQSDFWRKAVSELRGDLPGMVANIKHAFAENQIKELRLQAHRLHGAALYCGTPLLLDAAKALEMACVSAPDQIKVRLDELSALVAALDAYLIEYGIPDAGS